MMDTTAFQPAQPTTTSVYLPMLPRTLRFFHSRVHEGIGHCIGHFTASLDLTTGLNKKVLNNLCFSQESAARSLFENDDATLRGRPCVNKRAEEHLPATIAGKELKAP